MYPHLHLSANGERFKVADRVREAAAFKKSLPAGVKATIDQGALSMPPKRGTELLQDLTPERERH